jgi:hypothetical protein
MVNRQISKEVTDSLAGFGEVILFETSGITYPEVSGHADLFFCSGNGKLIVAPNTPRKYLNLLQKHGVDFITGRLPVGNKYPHTARYNVVITEDYLIHNTKITDPVIIETYNNLKTIHIGQGYARCSLLALKNNRFITSDKGIEKVLSKQGFEVLYVNPEGIVLPGYRHGFIGGTAGILENSIFFTGSLNRFSGGDKIRNFLCKDNYEIIESGNGPLFDAGSIIFI